MQLHNSFTLDAPVGAVWTTLRDLETTAQCFPGATVTKIDDEHYDATVQVRIGPMVASYHAAVTLVEWNDETRRAVMTAEAREMRGQGSASVRMTMAVTGERPTQVEIGSDLRITGRVAQLGGGAMQDVGEHLVREFATNLHERLASTPPASIVGAVAADAGSSSAPSADSPLPAARPINGLALVLVAVWRRVRARLARTSS
jgi:uncharacterized protein